MHKMPYSKSELFVVIEKTCSVFFFWYQYTFLNNLPLVFLRSQIFLFLSFKEVSKIKIFFNFMYRKAKLIFD